MGGSIQASLGGRYALALFDLAERRQEDRHASRRGLAAVRDALAQTDEFRDADHQPVGRPRRRDEGGASPSLKSSVLDPTTRSFLGVLARKSPPGRSCPQITRAFRTARRASPRRDHRGGDQRSSARPTRRSANSGSSCATRIGRDVSVDLSVDPEMLGGLVVRIGSQMIDSSIVPVSTLSRTR